MADGPVFSKNEYAYREIKGRILGEVLPAGSVLSQERIAAEMGVSTTPVREALKRLASEGLVRLDTHRDARVAELSAQEAISLYEVRQSVDPLAARLAAERRTPEDAEAISAALKDLRPLTGHADLHALTVHREFHRAIYRASHNQPLVDVLEGLWDKADRYRQVGLRLGRDADSDVRRVQAEHQALADAVLAGDAPGAELAMQVHIAKSLGRRAIDALSPASD